MTMLECRDLRKRYSGRGGHVDALRNVSLTLEQGEILGVVGESGSGKSTLLRLISGLEAPDGGELRLKGGLLGPRRTKADYRCIQMIFQDAAASFHPRRTIAASIRESVRSLCGRGAEPDRAGLAALVGLTPEFMDRRPGQLSGGQCQRFAIARAVAVSPELLLCDEVTSALDVSSQAQILRLLAGICREREMSALFVGHDLAVVSCLCDRILVMRDGAVVEEGPTERIIRAPGTAYTRELLDSVLELR